MTEMNLAIIKRLATISSHNKINVLCSETVVSQAVMKEEEEMHRERKH